MGNEMRGLGLHLFVGREKKKIAGSGAGEKMAGLTLEEALVQGIFEL
jgi:hypothetical protein